MKASELRIGNFIQTNEETITKVSGNVIYEGVEGCFKGIPLTKEWLIKLGLKKHGDEYYFSTFHELKDNRFLRKESYVSRWGDKEKGWLVVGSWEGFNDTPIKYVHQLQNLYFALTGEELQFAS